MKLSITRGTTMSFLLTIQNDDGTIYYLKDGEKLIFGVKFDIESDDYLIKKIIIAENREENGYLISLKPEDTQKLEFKDYRYDIGLQTNDGDYYMLVLCSPFVVNKAVTAKEWFLIGIIKKQEKIFGNLEKLNEKIVYKSDHRIVNTDLLNRIIKTKVNTTQIVYENEVEKWVM